MGGIHKRSEKSRDRYGGNFMRINLSASLFLFILLLSPFTVTGNFQNAVALLTPVADLTGDWSGFAQIRNSEGTCEFTGKVNAQLTQHENDIQGQFSFVITSARPSQPEYSCDQNWSIQQGVQGTLDGSRIMLYTEGGTFTGWYASSGIKLDIQAQDLTGTAQLSPTGFTPPPFKQKNETPPPPKCRADQVPVGDQCECPAGEEEIDGICQVPPPPPEVQNEPKKETGVVPGEESTQGDDSAELDKSLGDMKNEPEPKDWAEAGEPTVSGNSEQILQNKKLGNLQVYKGSATITTADGTVVDSNELKPGQTIQTGTNPNTNVKIDLENGGAINIKENTKLATFEINGMGFQSKEDVEKYLQRLPDEDFLGEDVQLEKIKQNKEAYSKLTGKTIAKAIAGGFLVGFFLPEVLITSAFVVLVGTVYVVSHPPKASVEQSRIILTPSAALFPKGTEYTVTVEDGKTKLDVIGGEVGVVPFDTNQPATTVNPGESLVVSDNKVEKTKLDTASIDRWWNKDLALEQGQQSSAPQATSEKKGGGCLIATAAFGSELAPQIQQLRETRDNVLFHTQSGTTFMNAFSQFYYTFSPTVADWERENPIFKEAVKMTITPMITTLSILNHVPIHSEAEILVYGIGVILLNIGMYFAFPVFAVIKLKRLIIKSHKKAS